MQHWPLLVLLQAFHAGVEASVAGLHEFAPGVGRYDGRSLDLLLMRLRNLGYELDFGRISRALGTLHLILVPDGRLKFDWDAVRRKRTHPTVYFSSRRAICSRFLPD